MKIKYNNVLNQYAAGNYDASYTTNREGFKVMFGVGQALGNAIVTQFNDKFQEPVTTTPTTPTDPATMIKVWMHQDKMLKINDIVTNGYRAIDLERHDIYSISFPERRHWRNVKWNKKAQQVTIKAGSDTLKFWMNKDFMEVNGKKNRWRYCICQLRQRTFVPLRFITELLNWNVKWAKTMIPLR